VNARIVIPADPGVEPGRAGIHLSTSLMLEIEVPGYMGPGSALRAVRDDS